MTHMSNAQNTPTTFNAYADRKLYVDGKGTYTVRDVHQRRYNNAAGMGDQAVYFAGWVKIRGEHVLVSVHPRKAYVDVMQGADTHRVDLDQEARNRIANAMSVERPITS